jgi:hypothetical protein
MHNIHDIKLIYSQNGLTSNVKLGIQNTKTKVIHRHKNDVSCVILRK